MLKKNKQLVLSIILALSIFPSLIRADDGSFFMSYKPPFIPIVINISEDGIDISGSRNIVTPWGTFSAGYDYQLKKFSSRDLILIIRNNRTKKDKVFKIKNGNDLSVFTNGSTLIETKNGKVIVDVTNSKNVKIQFSTNKEIKDNIVIPIDLKVFHRENRGDKFKLLSNNGYIKPNSKIKISLRSNKDVFAYVFHVKSTGSSDRLFPMRKLSNKILNNLNPIKGGVKKYLPSNTRSFILEEIESKDSIYFISLKKRDKTLEKNEYSHMDSNEKLISYLNKKYGSNYRRLYFSVGY